MRGKTHLELTRCDEVCLEPDAAFIDRLCVDPGTLSAVSAFVCHGGVLARGPA